MQFWMLTLVVFIVLIPSITTLECYVCNSNENTDCLDGTALEKYRTQCSQTVDPYCRKIVQTVHKKTSTVRTCGSKLGTKHCYKTAGANHASVCSCNTDLCNHASTLHRQARFITILSSMIIMGITMIMLR